MNEQLEIIVFNVEHGSCAFARTPNGRTILMDCGCSDDFSPAKHLYTYWGVRQIDLLVISHPDHDHVQDLPSVVDLFHIKTLLRNKTIPDNFACPGGDSAPLADRTYLGLHKRYNAPCDPGYEFSDYANWGGVSITTDSNSHALHRDMGVNDLSQILRLRYGTLDILFPGDIEPQGVEALMLRSGVFYAGQSPLPYRILVAPHHGRDSGVCSELSSAYAPTLTVMSDKWGVGTTNYSFYRNCSAGCCVYGKQSQLVQVKQVLSTKTNDYVYIAADASSCFVQVP